MVRKPVIWKANPRTRAKLEIVQAYLSAWFGILARAGFKHLIYIDGFCGPGLYEDGELGSPVVAAKIASATAAEYPDVKITLILIDQDLPTIEHLKSRDEISKAHTHVTVDIRHGEFANKLDEILAYLASKSQSPTFSFIDPFGFGQVSFEKLKPLMHNDRSELFINFFCGFMNRFKEHPDTDVTEKVRAMIGVPSLAPIIAASDPLNAMCEAYEANLRTLGQYVLKFMMRDEGNIRDNAFFFCGRQARGFEKIKEAMWKVDPHNGNGFSARTHEIESRHHPLFELGPQTYPLGTMLAEHFRGRMNVTISEIFKWVIESTPTFLPTHARVELDRLLESGTISYVDPEPSRRKRRAREWPSRILITFAL